MIAKKSLTTFQPELPYQKYGHVWEIDGSEIVQEDDSSKHFAEIIVPQLTATALKLMGLSSLQCKATLKSLFICGTGGSVRFSHTSNPDGNSNVTFMFPEL